MEIRSLAALAFIVIGALCPTDAVFAVQPKSERAKSAKPVASQIDYAPFTSPLSRSAFLAIEPGMPLAGVEKALKVKFMNVGMTSMGSKRYRHWITSDHSSIAAPFGELAVNDKGIITGTSQFGLK